MTGNTTMNNTQRTPALSPAECVAQTVQYVEQFAGIDLNESIPWCILKSHIATLTADLARLREPVVEWVEDLAWYAERLRINGMEVAAICDRRNGYHLTMYVRVTPDGRPEPIADNYNSLRFENAESARQWAIKDALAFYAAITGQGRVEG